MYRKSLSLVAVALLVATTGTLAAPVVLSNPYDVNSMTAWMSSTRNGQNINKCFSDFYYDGSYEITDFHWTGMFLSNDFSNLAGFGFVIYNDFAGIPGDFVYTQTVLGNANATPNGDLFDGGGGVVYDAYDFSLDLTAPWTAPVGIYYLNVYGQFFPGQNEFYWGTSQNQYGADDLQSGLNGIGLEQLSSEGDLAWEVTGNRLNVVPEPATMTLFGLGLLGSALAARRKRNEK